MNNVMNDKLFLTGRAHYGEAFWKAMRGNDAAYTDLAGAKHNFTNTYLLPERTATNYEKFALEQKTSYLGVEHLDGMLIRPEAVKVLTVTA